MYRFCSTIAVLLGALLVIAWPAQAQDATPTPGQTYTIRSYVGGRSGCPKPQRIPLINNGYVTIVADGFGCPLYIAQVGDEVPNEAKLGFIPRAPGQNLVESAINQFFNPGEVWNATQNMLQLNEFWVEEPNAAVTVYMTDAVLSVELIEGYPLAYSLACELAETPRFSDWVDIADPACRESVPEFNTSLMRKEPNQLQLLLYLGEPGAACNYKPHEVTFDGVETVEIKYTSEGCLVYNIMAGADTKVTDYYVINMTAGPGSGVTVQGDYDTAMNPGSVVRYVIEAGTVLQPSSRGTGGWLGFVPVSQLPADATQQEVLDYFCDAMPTPGCPE
jgi:hypothetical protein